MTASPEVGGSNCAISPAHESVELAALSHQLTLYARRLERRYALSRSDSADLVQEALLAFTIRRVRVEKPFAWLVTVLRRSSLRLLRSRLPQPVSLEDLGEGKQNLVSSSGEQVSADRLRIEEVLARLIFRHRRILWMRFVAGMSWSEMADELECKPSAAKKAVQRAVSAARQARLL